MNRHENVASRLPSALSIAASTRCLPTASASVVDSTFVCVCVCVFVCVLVSLQCFERERERRGRRRRSTDPLQRYGCDPVKCLRPTCPSRRSDRQRRGWDRRTRGRVCDRNATAMGLLHVASEREAAEALAAAEAEEEEENERES